ncbi:uroporphyrinogen-III synthase [Sphingopyxis sp.]|uniref:uroporphyrinogen-III synthase n=1 Tax=Sphingopyxis sp. TaxID=1908224 RepID=UPI003BAAD30A
MSCHPPLIVTRADPGGSATVERAKAMGLDARFMPLFEARPLQWDVPDAADFDALLMTSAQAARLAGPDLARIASLPVHAVGAATAAAAAAAGLRVVATGTRDAQSLIDAMASQKIQRILWICGRDRSDFDARAARLVPLPVYAIDAAPRPSGWSEAVAAPAVLLAHSMRGAARIADLVGAARSHLSLVAISRAVAAAAGEGWGQIAVAAQPDDASMLAAAHILCQKAE